jgi:hypothetical protein
MAGPLRPPLAPPAKIRRRRKRQRETIPEPIRRAVIEFAQGLQGNHAAVFVSNPRLKHRVARLLAAELPPARRRPGRPGLPDVTKAQRMLEELRCLYPNQPACILWRSIYPEVIEGYDSLSKPERRAAAQELCRRVGWRRRARRRSLTRRINV